MEGAEEENKYFLFRDTFTVFKKIIKMIHSDCAKFTRQRNV